jgi:HAE1 family hydrophobic/amphiphilic exporter-1
MVELAKDHQGAPDDVSLLYVRSPKTGELVPLNTVAEVRQTVGPSNVPHSEQLDAATISFNVNPGIPLGDAVKLLNQAAAEVVPPEIMGSLRGEAQEFERSMKSLGVLMIAAVFLMYVILGILYESYVHPFTVLTTLPVAAFGGLATLLIFRAELNLYAYIGMFALLGIIAKNGIMMVDFAEQQMHAGKSSFDAIHAACLIRFRPILMTGLAAIAGAVPIAVGYGADGSSRIPLGLVIVGGLAFAQVITLFVTPGIFLYMDALQKKLSPPSVTE